MLNSIQDLKNNLNKIALDVHGSDVEFDEDSYVSDRRSSHSFAHANPNYEIDQYKSEIRRLQESEAEIKALSVNYAALLKEKEDQISKLNGENGVLRHNLNTSNNVSRASRNENLKGNSNNSSNRQHKFATQVKNRSSGNQLYNGIVSKHDGLNNEGSRVFRPDAFESVIGLKHSNFTGKEKELADLLEEKNRSLVAAQATNETQIKHLKTELEKENNKSANLQLKLEDVNNMNVSSQEELKSLRKDKDKSLGCLLLVDTWME